MRRRFFVERFDEGSAAMRGETAEHLGRVLRAERGQLYELSDGSSVWLARVERIALAKSGKSEIRFELMEQIPPREPRLRLNVAISIVKFDRFEWCLEKATELGVTQITPLTAARSDRPLIAAAAKRHKRWERILVESAQQSRRLRPPILQEAVRPAEAFAKARAGMKVLLSEREDAKPIRQVLANVQADEVVLAFGPEGGWTEDEILAARGAAFAEASLGENVLRTETSVIAALAIVRFAVRPDI
jgi:16S rRNA (uracil1498-N3)-methyltransferase